MPVKYVGRLTSFRGKRLFDILSRVKNFGVGRMVYRHVFNERYPEPSYFVISKVQPVMSDPSEKNTDSAKIKAIAYGTKVWRGEQFGDTCIKTGFKSDWRLVPRDEEELWWNKIQKCAPRPIPVAPDTDSLPPLLEYLMQEDLKAAGRDPSEVPKLQLRKRNNKYNKSVYENSPSSQAQV